VSTTEPDTGTGDWPAIPYSDLQLLNLIGAGGIAKLYRARWITEGRDVAVKFLRKRFWRNRPAVAGLMQEAQILRSIKHPQIVTLLGSGRTAKGAAFLVLPWIDGEDFDAWRRRAQPDVNDIVTAMLSAMDAVAAAHGAGVVHCDLKPGNLLRDRDGRIFLTDFGFAHSLRTSEPLFVRGGTAGFLAPEQCSDAFGEIERRTDVYGLGATLYALLCGRPPFVGRDLPDVLAQVVASQLPPPPSHFCAASPAWLDSLVLRCLNKEPAERFGSVEELIVQIRRYSGFPNTAP
jgi:serine/threonine protein kinase